MTAPPKEFFVYLLEITMRVGQYLRTGRAVGPRQAGSKRALRRQPAQVVDKVKHRQGAGVMGRARARQAGDCVRRRGMLGGSDQGRIARDGRLCWRCRAGAGGGKASCCGQSGLVRDCPMRHGLRRLAAPALAGLRFQSAQG